MSAKEIAPQTAEIAAPRGDHFPTTPVQCSCGWRETDPGAGTWVQHMSAEALREVAETVAAIRDENPPSPGERPSRAASAYTSGWLQAIAEVFVVLDGVRESTVIPPGSRPAEEGER